MKFDFAQSWQFYALGSAFFAALTAILGKVGVSGIDSNLATWIRTIVIFFVASLLVQMQGGWDGLKSIAARPLLFLVLSGIATGLSWLCYYKALQLGPASKVAPVDKLSVALVILLSVLFLGEALTWKVLLGGLLITVGSLVLIL